MTKLIATNRSEQNVAPIDPWTLVHFSTGLAMGLLNVPRGWALGAALVYELAEQGLERKTLGNELFETKGPETPANALLDAAVFFAGHWLGTRWLRT